MALTKPKKIEWSNIRHQTTVSGCVGGGYSLTLAFLIRPQGNRTISIDQQEKLAKSNLGLNCHKYQLEIRLRGYVGEPIIKNLTLIGAKRKAKAILKEHITDLKVQLRTLQDTM